MIQFGLIKAKKDQMQKLQKKITKLQKNEKKW